MSCIVTLYCLSTSCISLYSEETESLWLTRMGKRECNTCVHKLTFSSFDCFRGDASQGMSINDALKEVLRSSRVVDGIARGLHEAVKTLDK